MQVIVIYEAFNWEAPLFGHMTLIVNEEKKKLSKRDFSIVQYISEYRSLGYLPEALFNFISLLGWSPSVNEEIMDKARIIELFDEKRLTKAPSMFEKEKLKFINHTYIKKMETDKLVEFLKPFLISLPEDDNWKNDFVKLIQDRLEYGAQVKDLYQEFFESEFVLENEVLSFLKEDIIYKEVIKEFYHKLNAIDFNEENIKNSLKEINKTLNVKGKALYMPTRIASTAMMHGPELPKLLILLGKERVLNNINKTLTVLEDLWKEYL